MSLIGVWGLRLGLMSVCAPVTSMCGFPPVIDTMKLEEPDAVNGGRNVLSFGLQTIGSSSSRTLTLTNSGSGGAVFRTIGQLELFGGPPISVGAPFFITGGTCVPGGSLSEGASCTLVVSFIPSQPGHTIRNGQVWYSGTDTSGTAGVGALNMILAGTGAAAGSSLVISDAPAYDFGAVTLGAASSKGFVVMRVGTKDAVLGAISESALGLAAPFSLQHTSCSAGQSMMGLKPLSLEAAVQEHDHPGSTPSAITSLCTVSIGFSPSQIGPALGRFQVSYQRASGEPSAAVSQLLLGSGK